MKLLAKFLVAVVANLIALIAAAYFVQGFDLAISPADIVIIGIVLTLLNLILKPILKMILGPIIILTLGLGLILVNMIILYILDRIFQNLTIENVAALIYSSLIIGFVNFIFHLASKE